jgi:putative oxidoreductase
MTATAEVETTKVHGGKGLRILLWTAQVLLALAFGMAGTMKLLKTGMFVEELGLPVAVVLFIGLSELTGAVGVIGPALTRVAPRLTSLAATGLATVMVLAIGFHLMHHQLGAIRLPVILLALATFVAWGRFRGAPIEPRARLRA